MQRGDLVKYQSYHEKLQHLIGVVLEVRHKPGSKYGDRCRILWNRSGNNPDVWDWVNDLEAISECR